MCHTDNLKRKIKRDNVYRLNILSRLRKNYLLLREELLLKVKVGKTKPVVLVSTMFNGVFIPAIAWMIVELTENLWMVLFTLELSIYSEGELIQEII